jgi:hypothetical protein
VVFQPDTEIRRAVTPRQAVVPAQVVPSW